MYASNYYNHVTVIQMIQNSSSQLSKGKKPASDPVWTIKQY